MIYMCATGRLYLLLMTPQLEVLKHFGHANFDDSMQISRSEVIFPIYHCLG